MIDLNRLEDMPVVRRVREGLRKRWGLEIGLTLADGYVTAHAEGKVVAPGNRYCRAALGSGEGFQRCNRSVAQAASAISAGAPSTPRALRVDTCHLGFPMVFVPLVSRGRFLGAIFVGGFVQEHDTEQRLARIGREVVRAGLSVAMMGGGSADVPVLSAPEYDLLCEWLELLADELLQWPSVVERLESQGGIREVEERIQFEAIVGSSPVMQRLFTMIERVAPSDSTVLITGEDGTGKELVAHAIHARSRRNNKPFVIRNCSAFNDNLLESELFGHVRGAFTGAERDRRGVFELAHTGTLFLDEVGDTSPAMQVKLLRVLQDRSFVAVGGSNQVQVDVRVVAATNRPLLEMVAKGTFRKDLYYRLNVINLQLPPLRERADDLPQLCDAFLARMSIRAGGPAKRLSPGTVARILAYHWPGNIRELQSEIERLYVLSGDSELIREEWLSPAVLDAAPAPAHSRRAGHSLAEQVRELERAAIIHQLVRHQWNKKRVAAELDISRTTLHRKIEEFGLSGPEVKLP